MDRQPDFEDLFRVISQASIGENVRVPLPPELDMDNPATKLAAALNVLLDDLAYRSHELQTQYEALRKTEEQLRQSQKMEGIGRLAGGIAHDFNNLLTVILSHAYILKASLGGEEQKNDVAQILKAAGRAANLTRQLLAFSRQQIVEPGIIDLNELIEDMDTMIRRLVGEDIKIRVKLDGNLERVRADMGHMEQVVLNLVVNARDAMPGGGFLTLETGNLYLEDDSPPDNPDALRGPYVMVAVTDTGVGMDEATQSHLFEPFFTTKEVGRGTGLGLSTVYGIVKQNNGGIRVTSRPGQGSCFRIYLPVASTDAAPDVAPGPAPQIEKASGTVLLVEDDEQVRSVAARILRQNGYAVLATGNPGEALAICRDQSKQIDLLLTDIVMPVINGRELAQKLAVIRPGLKVLYMSGYPREIVVHKNMLDPGIELLPKPFAPELLLARVHGILHQPS